MSREGGEASKYEHRWAGKRSGMCRSRAAQGWVGAESRECAELDQQLSLTEFYTHLLVSTCRARESSSLGTWGGEGGGGGGGMLGTP